MEKINTLHFDTGKITKELLIENVSYTLTVTNINESISFVAQDQNHNIYTISITYKELTKMPIFKNFDSIEEMLVGLQKLFNDEKSTYTIDNNNFVLNLSIEIMNTTKKVSITLEKEDDMLIKSNYTKEISLNQPDQINETVDFDFYLDLESK